ncbi:hypothetical protein Lal_00032251 [Lupinus albus]|nr:hypothetical protein Lal_00032251 [Lupinus albus]
MSSSEYDEYDNATTTLLDPPTWNYSSCKASKALDKLVRKTSSPWIRLTTSVVLRWVSGDS